jgi:hypothetical protein
LGEHDETRTHRIRFFSKGIDEDSQKLIRIIDLVSIFPDNPDQRGFGFWLVQFVQICT